LHCQIVALNLMPWQNPPCFADMRGWDESYGENASLLNWQCECGAAAFLGGIQIPRASATGSSKIGFVSWPSTSRRILFG
jgi:hypothetical protein